RLIGGGISCLDHDRDNQLYKGFVEASYDFSPGYSLFVRGTYNDDHYFINPLNPNGGDRNGDLRSSHGYTFDTGLNLLLTDLVSAQLYLGYLDQMYIKHQPHPLSDVSGLDFGANLNWYPTELLTIHLSALRQIENIVLPGASAGDDKSVALSAEYEVTRRIFATGSVGFDDVLYKMIPPPSLTDKTLSAGLGVKWLVSHYLTASANYNYSIRSSTRAGGSYDDNLVSVALNLQI
ncbi:MAG: outer membrane beta-barrel protein, partial [Alphaproteobacteria bacterium]|nr:outer membrane beta-barrel protein [Alphaproteobacteria bacterium]